MVSPTLNQLEGGEEQLSIVSRIICQFTAIISLHGEMSKEATEYPIIRGQNRNIQELSAIMKLLFGCNLAKKKKKALTVPPQESLINFNSLLPHENTFLKERNNAPPHPPSHMPGDKVTGKKPLATMTPMCLPGPGCQAPGVMAFCPQRMLLSLNRFHYTNSYPC